MKEGKSQNKVGYTDDAMLDHRHPDMEKGLMKDSFSSPEGKTDQAKPQKNNLPFYITTLTLWLLFILLQTLPDSNPQQWLSKWSVWDAHWYKKIWEVGYQNDPKALVFPPGYSLLVGSLAALTSLPFGTSAFLINIIALTYATITLTETLGTRFQINKKEFFLFTLSVPPLYYSMMPYTDTLFFALFAAALKIGIKNPETLTRKEEILAGSLLFLAPFVRLTGYALTSWVFLKRRYAMTPIIALACWLGLNFFVTGDPLAFLGYQKEFYMPPGGFLTGFSASLHSLLQGMPPASDPGGRSLWLSAYALPAIAVLLLGATALWLALRKEWLLCLTILSLILLTHNQAFWRSGLRYNLPILPFIALPLLATASSQIRLPNPNKTLILILKIGFYALLTTNFLLQSRFTQAAYAGGWTF